MVNNSSGRKSLLILITKIIMMSSSFVGFYFVAHYMGPEVLGIVGFASSFVGFFSLFIDPGLNTTHIKMVNSLGDKGKCNGTYIFLKFFLIFLTIALIIISTKYYKYFFVKDEFFDERIIYITIVGAVATYISSSFKTVFNSSLLTAKQEIPEYFGILILPMKIFIAFREMGALALASINSLGFLFSCGASFYFFKGTHLSRPSKDYGKQYLSYAFPIALVDISRAASMNLDRIIIQLFWGPLFVGYYYAAQRIIVLLDHIFKSINQIIFPQMINFSNSKDFSSMIRLLNKAVFNLIFTLTPIVIVFSFFSSRIIYLLAGDQFDYSANILGILCIWVILSGVNKLFQNVILSCGYNVFYGKVGVLISSITVLLNILLVPNSIYGARLFGLGPIGAALSLLIASLLGLAINAKHLRKIINYKIENRLFLILIPIFLTVFFLFFIKSKNLLVNDGYTLIFIFLSMGIYLGTSILFRVISKQEIYVYGKIFNPSAMFNYIKNELKNN